MFTLHLAVQLYATPYMLHAQQLAHMRQIGQQLVLHVRPPGQVEPTGHQQLGNRRIQLELSHLEALRLRFEVDWDGRRTISPTWEG